MTAAPAAPPSAAPAASPSATPAPADNAGTPSLPVLAAMLVQLQVMRLPLKQSVDTFDAEIERVSLLAHAAMVQSGITSFSTADAVFALKPKVVYHANDWEALQQHVSTTGEFDLIVRRLSSTALRERGAELPPGVERNEFMQFSFTPTKKGIK